jgi:hypothetical protein
MPISTINNKSIADGTIIATDILDGTISSSKLVSANIAGDRLLANTLSNTVFQTGSVENYLRGANLDFGMRNKLINGSMRIDQRNSGSANTPGDQNYTLDRWQTRVSQSSKFTVQQDSSANTVAGFTNSLKVVSSSAYSVISSDIFSVGQKIEGLNCTDLAWGTASARPVTLSFWVRSSLTGAFGGALNNSAFDRSYPFSYTISAANTWEYKTITISGDTTGTWLTSNSNGIDLRFSLGVGSQYTTTGGAWTAGNYWQPTGSTSIVGTSGATWYVTGVQLEEGSVPTPFEYRSYGTELALCQRYFTVITNGTGNSAYGPYGLCRNQLTLCVSAPLSVQMRTAPSVSFTINSGTNVLKQDGATYAVSTMVAAGISVNQIGYETTIGTSSLTTTGCAGYYGGSFSILASAEL